MRVSTALFTSSTSFLICSMEASSSADAPASASCSSASHCAFSSSSCDRTVAMASCLASFRSAPASLSFANLISPRTIISSTLSWNSLRASSSDLAASAPASGPSSSTRRSRSRFISSSQISSMSICSLSLSGRSSGMFSWRVQAGSSGAKTVAGSKERSLSTSERISSSPPVDLRPNAAKLEPGPAPAAFVSLFFLRLYLNPSSTTTSLPVLVMPRVARGSDASCA
mmetsp:Transcript_13166/g.55635  ORF Transcript_13166/g.55635 Transcript_13166/m.55635 type:complete len:227 (-) Transcript_13166:155-835(-)